MSTNEPSATPPAGFIPTQGETDIDNPAPRAPYPRPGLLADTMPPTDPAADLADRVAALLDEPATDRSREPFSSGTQTDSDFASQTPAQDDNFDGQRHTQPLGVDDEPPSPDQGDGGGPAVHADLDSRGATPDNTPNADAGEDVGEGADAGGDEDLSLDGLAEQILGRPATRDEKIGIARLYYDAMQLPEDRRMEMARVLGYTNEPQPQQTQQQPAPTTHEPPAPSTSTSQIPPDEDDPYITPHIAPLRDEIEQLRSTVSHLTETNQQTERERLAEQAQSAIDKFKADNPYLSDQDIAEMQVTAGSEFAVRFQQTGDMARATEDTFNSLLWANPKYRERALAAQQERQRETEANEKLRQQRAASLAPGGAQVTRDENTAPTPPPKDRQDMRHQLRDELAGIMSQS